LSVKDGKARPLQSRSDSRIALTFRKLTSSLRDHPDFLVIGVQKSSTSSLHEHLASSRGTAPSRIKEVHYFDRESFLKGDGWYRSYFGLRLFKRGRRSFESTPGYFELDVARRRLAAELPQAKLVVVMRSPAERARSQFLMGQRMGIESRSFRQAINDEVVRHHSARDYSGEDQAIETDPEHRYKGRGLYADRLQALLELNVRTPILILFMESLIADPGPSLRLLHEFVEIPPPPPVALPHRHKAPNGAVVGGPQPDEVLVLEELRRFFVPENAKLRELLVERPEAFVTLPQETWPSWVAGESDLA